MARQVGILGVALWLVAGAVEAASGALPLCFEQNRGQAEGQISYLAHGPGYSLRLEARGAVLQTGASILRMRLDGADASAAAEGLDPLPTRVNYLVGDDPSRWLTDVPTYGRVAFRGVYPGVDVVFSGASGELEYEFVLAPRAEMARIRVVFEGAEDVRVNDDGDLVIRTAAGEFHQSPLQLFQVRDGLRKSVAGRYSVQGHGEVVFEPGEYDRSAELTLAPTVVYGSFFGGRGNDTATSMAVDTAGNLYIAGWTESTDLPGGTGNRNGTGGGNDVYVAKLNPLGNTISYLTYLGGRGDDRALGIAVDATGAAAIAGATYSSDFPVATAAQAKLAGVRNCFVARLKPAGNGLTFSTYLGGSGSDACNSVALDPQGNIYVAGETNSPAFPVSSAFQSRPGGGLDAFAAKYSSAGTRLYSTYLGGLGDDRGTAVAADNSGNAYLTGSTYSGNFPVLNAVQPRLGGGQDAFVAKLSSSGSALLYSTYLGGSGGGVGSPESGAGIAVDAAGCAYVTGTTSSSNFPLGNPYQSVAADSQDVFVTKLSASGNALVFSTYYGGHGYDSATGIALDSAGNVYVTGYTAAQDLPAINALQSFNAGAYDAFLAKFGSTGNSVLQATYFGGSGSDSANAVALDPAGNIYLAGQSQSPDLPLSHGIQLYKPGAMSTFILKTTLNMTAAIAGQVTVSGTGAGIAGVTVTLSGAASAVAVTDFLGNFAFTGLTVGASYVVTPALSGYSFTPSGQSIPSAAANQTVNFSGATGTNVALRKAATQSSTIPYFANCGAGNAVDGNTDGNFAVGSDTHTDLDANPWWQVDLGGSSTIGTIVIWNRSDCCGWRLVDYWVFVSNTPFSATDTPSTLQSRAGTWASHQTVSPNPSTTVAVAYQGRYVRIQLSAPGYLSLAEVQVVGTAVVVPPPVGTDLALGRSATQSSTIPYFANVGARNAVDGNTDGNFAAGSDTHTDFDANAWWQVDLGGSATVNSIVLWNRTDCCGYRLSDYWVFVSDTPFGAADTPATLQYRAATWSSHQVSMPGPSSTLNVGGYQGRYVRVQLSAPGYLSLAEVQVIGTAVTVAPVLSNVALRKAASQSSTIPYFANVAASNAVDGNTDGNFAAGSDTHTDLNNYPWWQVDLGASATVDSVVVWNRTDCCGNRLGDYWVFVSDTPFGASDTPATLQSRAGTWSSHQTTYPNPSTSISAGNAHGRYVRVQLSVQGYLSLAEVQVMGY